MRFILLTDQNTIQQAKMEIKEMKLNFSKHSKALITTMSTVIWQC